MKGFRTVIYHIATGLAAVLAVLVTINWTDVGFTTEAAILVAAGLKIADSLVSLYLRAITSTPIGKAD